MKKVTLSIEIMMILNLLLYLIILFDLLKQRIVISDICKLFKFSKIEGKTFRDECNKFAEKRRTNNTWAFKLILEFLQMQKQRVERKEITSETALFT
jgi:hypothetical protein